MEESKVDIDMSQTERVTTDRETTGPLGHQMITDINPLDAGRWSTNFAQTSLRRHETVD